MSGMPEPLEPPRVTFEELTRLAAEVMGVSARAVTSPWHDKTAVHIGAIAEATTGRAEYRSIDVAVLRCQDTDGSEEDVHAYAVLFDVLEGILRRRFARRTRAHVQGEAPSDLGPVQGSLDEPPSETRLKFAPAVDSVMPPSDDEPA